MANITGTAGADRLLGTNNNDTLTGGNSNDDTEDYSAIGAGVTLDLTVMMAQTSTGDASGDTLSGIENLIGSVFGDTLTGDANNNLLDGGAGSGAIGVPQFATVTGMPSLDNTDFTVFTTVV